MSTKMKMLMGIVMSAACLGAWGDIVYLVDFNQNTGAGSTPGITWNEEITPDDPDSGLGLLDTNGNPSSINITFSGSINNSGSSSDQWSGRDANQAPLWSTPEALFDRLFVGDGNTATMTISGLNPSLTYSFEIASGYDSGSAARGPATYTMTGGNGDAEGFRLFFDQDDNLQQESKGTNVLWAANTATSGAGDLDEEGWLGWFDVLPNSSGEISLFIDVDEGGTGTNPRGSLNAMQITAIPEPGTLMLVGIALGAGLLTLRRRR